LSEIEPLRRRAPFWRCLPSSAVDLIAPRVVLQRSEEMLLTGRPAQVQLFATVVRILRAAMDNEHVGPEVA